MANYFQTCGIIFAAYAMSAGVLFPKSAYAIEGAIGRPLTGVAVMPHAGLIPPSPGLSFSVGEMFYDGSIGGDRVVPISGNLALGINAKASFTPISFAYTWNGTNTLNFASAISAPILEIEVSADATAGRLAQLSLNNWTVAYTTMFTKHIIESTGTSDEELYNENPAAPYHNGVLSDLEAIAMKRGKSGLGWDAIASRIQRGGVANSINGFSGRTFSTRPVAIYTTEIYKHVLDFNVRSIGDYATKNRAKGSLFMFAGTFKF